MSESTGHGSRYVKGCQCDRCAAARRRARERARAHPDKNNPQRRRYKTEKQRQYDDANRDALNGRARERYSAWRAANPLPPRASANPGGRHGGPDEWARMYDEQGGLCYLCLRPLSGNRTGVHVDHDHSCCDPGPKGRDTRSCQYCRRGLVHERCNQIWGLAKEDPDLLRTMADQGERVRDETRRRIAGKPYAQAALGVDAQSAVDEAAPEAMPDLDMPVGMSWPKEHDTLF